MTALLGFLAALLLLAPASDPEDYRFFLDAPAVEAAWLGALLGGLGILGLRLPRAAAWTLAGLVVTAALLNLAAAATPALLGRELELWWDLRHLPSLWGMARGGAGLLPVLAAAGAAIGLAAALFALLGWLLSRRPGQRAVSAATLVAALVVIIALPPRVAPVLAKQAEVAWHAYEAERGVDNAWRRALDQKLPPYSDLAGLGGRDVHLVFVESYGAAALSIAGVRDALARFGEDAAQAGYAPVSHRLLSPTYGGASWLAHSTIASGIRIPDQLTYRLLLESARPTLPSLMKAAGYRTIQVVPGIKKPYPEASFWGFDRIWDAASLGYEGPPFGWFAVPDQATLRRVLEAESEGPLFAEWVLVSSHVPFAPVPPHVPWEDAGAYRTVDQATWDRVYAAPDWRRLDIPYAESLDYVFRVLADMTARLPRDAILIVLGDHQPPALVLPGDDWSVPIHVLAREPALLEKFRRLGYVDGLLPGTAAPRPMERFLADFLGAFDRTTASASR